LEHPGTVRALRWWGLGVLLWSSWKMATAGRSGATTDKACVGFWEAAAFQWVNPKSWLVSASAVGTYLHADAGSAFVQSLSFGLLFVLVALPSGFVWLACGATVQRCLHAERTLSIFNVAMGATLAGSVLLFVW